MTRKRWTPAEDERLESLAGDGLSGGEVATVLKRPEGGVRARAAKLGVTFASGDHNQLRTFLAAGGRLIREDIGGVSVFAGLALIDPAQPSPRPYANACWSLASSARTHTATPS